MSLKRKVLGCVALGLLGAFIAANVMMNDVNVADNNTDLSVITKVSNASGGDDI